MTSGSVIIDTMTEADLAEVAALQATAFPPHAASSGRGGENATDAGRATESQLREELARPWARLWVAREAVARQADGAGRALAFLLAWHVADELHVLNVATHPDHRRRGIALRLMEHAIDFARAHKGRLVLLEVRRSNAAAIALYRRLTFFAMGLRRAYYSDGEDAVEMGLIMDTETGVVVPHADEARIDPV